MLTWLAAQEVVIYSLWWKFCQNDDISVSPAPRSVKTYINFLGNFCPRPICGTQCVYICSCFRHHPPVTHDHNNDSHATIVAKYRKYTQRINNCNDKIKNYWGNVGIHLQVQRICHYIRYALHLYPSYTRSLISHMTQGILTTCST